MSSSLALPDRDGQLVAVKMSTSVHLCERGVRVWIDRLGAGPGRARSYPVPVTGATPDSRVDREGQRRVSREAGLRGRPRLGLGPASVHDMNARVAACYAWAETNGVLVVDEIIVWGAAMTAAVLTDVVAACLQDDADLLVHADVALPDIDGVTLRGSRARCV
jgi:hypothetical protein